MSSSAEFLYLSRKTLETLQIPAMEIVERIERLLRDGANGQVWSAPKSVFTPPDGRYLMSTLSAADEPPLLAVKALVLNPKNPERGLKGINSTVVLLNSQTGLPAAIMDGNWVTAIRTAGLSAVAAMRLARRESRIVAFIGCGVQAHSHLQLLSELFPLREVHAFGRGTTNRDQLCKSAESLGLRAIASNSGEKAIRDADIVVTSVTFCSSLAPFLDARWLKQGAFVTSTDFAFPWIPDGMRTFDQIVIDDLQQEATMPRPMVASDLVSGDLTGLVTREIGCRTSEAERTAFVFRGIAIGDLALATLAFEKARENSLGVSIEA